MRSNASETKMVYYVIGVVGAAIVLWVSIGIEEIGVGIFIALLVLGLCFLYGKSMEIANKLPDGIDGTNVIEYEPNALHKSGLPGTGSENCVICARKEDLYIKSPNAEYTIKYDKIYNAVCTTNYEVVQTIQTKVKNKGTAGKALIGGLTFGVGGAIVGAAMGSKGKAQSTVTNKEVPKNLFLLITYEDKNGEVSEMTFECPTYGNFKRLEAEINSHAANGQQLESNGTIEL